MLGAAPADRCAAWAAEVTWATAEGRCLCVRRGAGGGKKLCPRSSSSGSSSCASVSGVEVGLYLIEGKKDYSASDSRGGLQEKLFAVDYGDIIF